MVNTLEGTARYAGILLAPAEAFGLRPRHFLPLGQKKEFFKAVFLLILGRFWSSVVTSVRLCSNLSYFSKGPKKKISPKILENIFIKKLLKK